MRFSRRAPISSPATPARSRGATGREGSDPRVVEALKRHINSQAKTITLLNDSCSELTSRLREIEHDLRVAKTERDYWQRKATE